MLIENETQQPSAGKSGSSTFSQAQKDISHQEKFCAAPSCGKQLFRKKGENSAQFNKRRHCDHACAKYLIGRVWRGKTRAKKTVPCPGCKKPIVRAVVSSRMRCEGCFRKRHLRGQNAKNREVRKQARYYRILMTSLGFDCPEEAIAYLKTVPWTTKSGLRIRDLRSAA